MSFKTGDMVMVLRVDSGSGAWKAGLRPGAIGTVTRFSACKCGDPGCPLDTDVLFPNVGECCCWSMTLRKIPPQEPGNWADCIWRPMTRERYQEMHGESELGY